MTRELLEELIWYAVRLKTDWALRKAISYIVILREKEKANKETAS